MTRLFPHTPEVPLISCKDAHVQKPLLSLIAMKSANSLKENFNCSVANHLTVLLAGVSRSCGCQSISSKEIQGNYIDLIKMIIVVDV